MENKKTIADYKKIIAKINIAEYKEFIGDLKYNELPFTTMGTTFTKRIECALGNFKFSDNSGGIKMNELYFIKKIDSHCSSLENIPIVDINRITYTRRNHFKKKSLSKQLYEIDLTAAYWSMAYREGFITKELYEEGLRLSKKIKLVALGALAKQILIMEFNGFEYINIIKEPLLPKSNIFFRVSQLTDQYLKTAFLSLGESALFYWVDALFLQGDRNFKLICNYFRSKKLEFKYYEVDRISFSGDLIKVKSKDWALKHDMPFDYERPYQFEK